MGDQHGTPSPETTGRERFGPAHGDARAYDWRDYFDAVRGQGPRDTLLRALECFEAQRAPDARAAEPLAVDLGCGSGRDTLELLRRGWRVVAIDLSPAGLAELEALAAGIAPGRLRTVLQRFEDALWPVCDLLNASFSIPHTDPDDFPALWRKITASIRPGGRFAGQLFGVRDGWATRPDGIVRTYHDRADVLRLFEGFELECLDEVERPGKNAMGEPKDWHVFLVVARRLK